MIESDCGNITISICRNVRKMVSEKQYQLMIKNKDQVKIEKVVESLLDEMAKEYFKEKK